MTKTQFNFPEAFVIAFGAAHVLSTVVGIWSPLVGPTLSAVGMTVLGLLTIAATLPHKIVVPLRMSLAVFYVWAFLAEWTQFPQWIPAWTNTQYVVMSLVNLTCAVCLLMIGGASELLKDEVVDHR